MFPILVFTIDHDDPSQPIISGIRMGKLENSVDGTQQNRDGQWQRLSGSSGKNGWIFGCGRFSEFFETRQYIETHQR
ncbi:hypothetical protein SDC9_128556 [bioreactor metagenome]|uniref:Uncharacterized protein n=1 Tax=bioreactor metagenome TaxID=1076179 RepID=A0A645CXA0_9ZZZZ